MSKGEKIGMTLLTSVLFGMYITAASMRFGFWHWKTIYIVGLAVLMLVMIWTARDDKGNGRVTNLIYRINQMRRVWRDMRDEDNPKRIARRKNRRTLFERHITAFFIIIMLIEGAGWIWSVTEHYHIVLHTVAFLGTCVACSLTCEQKVAENTN